MLDVLIAGAGPAGSVAATLLARAGARVLIVDRETFPRDKLCGDTLNPGVVKLLQSIDLWGGPLATAPAARRHGADRPDRTRGRAVRRRARRPRDHAPRARRVAARPGDRRGRAIRSGRDRARSARRPLACGDRRARPRAGATRATLADDARARGHDARGRRPPLGPRARARLEPRIRSGRAAGRSACTRRASTASPTSARCTFGRPPIWALRRSVGDSRTCAR